MRFIILLYLSILLVACGNHSAIKSNAYSYDNVRTINTVEEVPLNYRFDYPEGVSPVPLLVVIDGSTCRGIEGNSLLTVLKPDNSAPKPYARLIVEKIGVNQNDTGENCSDLFLQNYSIEDRLIQHLRALQHLRKNSTWWNGDLLIWGWSDGGDIGAQLTAYYPNTKRAVIGAMGGGITMAESFRDEDFCSKEKFETVKEREICVNKLEGRFETIRRNPKWDETWLGGDNTLKVWETRLFSRLSHLLIDNKVPLLIVHGEKDKGQIKGAQRLRKELEDAGNEAFTYWEIAGMGHSPRNMTKEQNKLLYDAMRDWLILGNTPQPNLGAPEFEIP